MLPVYFPFTDLSESMMDDIGKFFERIAVYQVSKGTTPQRVKAWCDKGKIDVRTPLQDHEREITALLKAYRIWAEQHQGGDISFFKTQADSIPFFDETSVSQIRKNIKGLSKSGGTPETGRPTDFSREIFLLMAQDFDAKNQDIARELNTQADRERELMENLKGEALPDLLDGAGAGPAASNQTDYMIPNRLTAWGHLMLTDTGLTPIAVTSTRSALDELVERVLEPEDVVRLPSITELAGDSDGGAKQKADLWAYIEKLASLSRPDAEALPDIAWEGSGAATAARLSWVLIPGMTIRELFDLYARSVKAGCRIERDEDNDRGNVLLGLIEPGMV